MKIKTFLALLSLGCMSFAVVAQQPTLQQITQQLAIPQIMQCQFQQQRFLSGLAKPLKASGVMVLDQQIGVALSQQKPFAQVTAITTNKLIQSINQQKQVISEQEQPQLFHITNLLFSLFQGQFTSVSDYFTLTQQTQNKQQWFITLLPKQSPFNQLLQQIKLEGEKHIQVVDIIDKQQDRTLLTFEHCQPIEKLNNEQQQWFKTE